jgi:hypothetical protein
MSSNQYAQSDDPTDAIRYAQAAFQYNAALQRPFVPYTWVFNGKPCSLQEFADAIWPGEHEDKMLFILTHSGPKQK